MREKLIPVELTPNEVLLNSQALYLATWAVQPDLQSDRMVALALKNIRQNEQEWLAYLAKMHKVAVLMGTREGC